MPQLRNDSASRTALKARFLEYLHAAGAAALVGEGFIARHRAANVPGGSPHVRAVERALEIRSSRVPGQLPAPEAIEELLDLIALAAEE